MELLNIIQNDNVEKLEEYLQEVDTYDIKLTLKTSRSKNAFEIDINLCDEPTAISVAAFYGSIKCFNTLYMCEADPLIQDQKGRLTSHFAAAGGSVEICDILDCIGTDFSICDNQGLNCFHYACMYGKMEIVERLWMRNFDINKPSDDGLFPIHYAAKSNNSEVIKFLAEKGCDINSNVNGITPVSIALQNSPDVLDYLLSQNVDINFIIDEDKTPLIDATIRKKPEIVKAILKHFEIDKDDINQSDSLGWTPLLFAASNGSFEICKMLIQKGADVNCHSSHGFSPLMAARNRGFPEIYSLLEKNGAKKLFPNSSE